MVSVHFIQCGSVPFKNVGIRGNKQVTNSWKTLFADPIILCTVVIATATVCNLYISYRLWDSTARSADLARKSFEAGNRPYIGIERLTLNRDDKKHALSFSLVIKNFGNVPAEGDMRWRTFLNGQEQPSIHLSHGTDLLMPGQESELGPSGMNDGVFNSVVSGASILEFCFSAKYKGTEGSAYTHSEKERFDPGPNRFHIIGPCELQ
jgi:hypothetical protein